MELLGLDSYKTILAWRRQMIAMQLNRSLISTDAGLVLTRRCRTTPSDSQPSPSSSGQSPQHPRRVAVDQVQQHQRRAVGVAVANFPNDVWLYDQRSSRGTRLDGNAVQGRKFLDGVHRVMVGRNKR